MLFQHAVVDHQQRDLLARHHGPLQGTLDTAVLALYATCVVVAAAGLLVDMHGHFDFEGWPLFFGLFGFAGYTFIVFAAKGLRRLLKREEDYYDV